MASKVIDRSGVDLSKNVEHVPVAHSVELELAEAPGERVGGDIVAVKVLINSERLTQFVNQVMPEVISLPFEDRHKWDSAIEDLRASDETRNKRAVEWLYHAAMRPDAGVLGTYIYSFLGIQPSLG